MLKRSFAEFHAQKKLPEQQQLLMRKLACKVDGKFGVKTKATLLLLAEDAFTITPSK